VNTGLGELWIGFNYSWLPVARAFPDFDVHVEYSGEQGFKWCGKVYNTGLVSETSITK